MDDADRSDQRIEDAITEGIYRARAKPVVGLNAIGVCHWCESPVGAGRVFCSDECRDDHRHEEERRKAMGL